VKGERAQAVIKKHRDELYQITVQRYIFFLKQQSSFFVIFLENIYIFNQNANKKEKESCIAMCKK